MTLARSRHTFRKLWHWITRLVTGRPHFAIGGWDNPYLLRWYLLPRNPWLNVYLHKFLRDDDDRALHCHPWWFVSVMLKGGYREWVPDEPRPFPFRNVIRQIKRTAPSVVYRRAEHRHRVELFRDVDADGRIVNRPCWTIVITGPKVREWGFWCPKGFVPWHQFVDTTDHGNVGRGCE